MTMDRTLTDSELITEVRDAMAGLDSSKVPDDTITQTADSFVIPVLNDLLSTDVDQDQFDNAVVAYTAEMAFGAWLSFTRLRDREVEVYLDTEQYLSQLKEKTDLALRVIGLTRPSQIPNTVVTIKHDGKKRKVDLQKEWKLPN
jgi:hypothetical protein